MEKSDTKKFIDIKDKKRLRIFYRSVYSRLIINFLFIAVQIFVLALFVLRLEKYLELAKNVTRPEDNPRYPDSIRGNGALRSLYDNCGEDEELTLKIHDAVMGSRQVGFRSSIIKQRKIKQALYKLLKDEAEVERIHGIVAEQEEY